MMKTMVLAMSAILRLASISLMLGVILVVALCIRRLYFHPLSKYPGPFLARVTDFYAAYHAWKGDIHVDMWRQHERYGPYVRYAPDKLNINTAGALKDIYSGTVNFQKSPNYRVLRHGAANTLTMINTQEHARRRRIVSQGLSDAALRSHEPTLMAHIKKCFALGREHGWTPPCNMSNWFNWLTFDIMGDVVFGIRYDLLGSPTNRRIPNAIEQSNVRVSVLLQSPFLRQIGRVDRWLFPKAIEARNQFLYFVGGLVKRVMKAEFDVKEILAESTTLSVAGADTSSTALAAVFFYLASTPHAYKRLRDDVRSAFATADEIQTGPKLSKLTYLRACIDEALRMSPPAGSSLYREVQAGGATVDGQTLPAGMQAGVPIYAIHHNPRYFPAPFEYRPERWLPGEAGAMGISPEVARTAFCPFSVGTRSCVGRGMALIELNLTIAYAMFTLDFFIADENKTLKGWGLPGEFPLADHITGSKDGPFLHFKPRDA
ncbi:cytochrome p450 domain-containing protein [Hirsutella rhossiliensis]|uniref:Cytochrome p450 domain-containing protein n=1 Tax=Hirsutella rhossiliensis TaxID=111463 RepID=A0A9P8N0P2_9HYPO|nr:cytochrome p450 domain-containing protein [Hirsutella rhossiliensis]KAH0963791.1 cytochrome p450 domain-containing protein [Hirsutella rhossiliensis]